MNNLTFSIIKRASLFILFFLLIFISEASSDTIYLKNGRKMEGLIKKETKDAIWLDLGIGSVKFKWEEIQEIDRSHPDEVASMRQKWRREEETDRRSGKEKRRGPKEVDFVKKGSRMIAVDALLNNKVNATLLLDTGAYYVMITRRIAKELGMKIKGTRERIIELQVGDGRLVEAEYIILDSVNVQSAELRDVEAAVVLDVEDDIEDGLLGMSFLNNFKFQIDNVSKKLTLERKKAQSILQKAGNFSVMIPSNWESWIEGKSLFIYGPKLITKDGLAEPRIMITQFTQARALGFIDSIRDRYNSYKGLSGVGRKMSELQEQSFKNSYPQNKFISSSFEEKKDGSMLHTVYIDKEEGLKKHNVYFIGKDEAVGGHALAFACPEKHFDKYLPVFEKCLESFSIKPNQ